MSSEVSAGFGDNKIYIISNYIYVLASSLSHEVFMHFYHVISLTFY